MSRWLDIAARAEKNTNTPTDVQQEPAKFPYAGTQPPFLLVSADCREREPEKGQKTRDKAIDALMDRFRERAAVLEFGEGLPRDRATWLAALAVFVLPDERAGSFEGNSIKLRHQQVSIALSEGVAITFHCNGLVSFHGGFNPNR